MDKYDSITSHPLYDPLEKWVCERLGLEPGDMAPGIVEHVINAIVRKEGFVSRDLKPWEIETGNADITYRFCDPFRDKVYIISEEDMERFAEEVEE